MIFLQLYTKFWKVLIIKNDPSVFVSFDSTATVSQFICSTVIVAHFVQKSPYCCDIKQVL